MGCCHGIRPVTFQSKEYIINLAPKDIEDIMEDNTKFPSEKKYRKQSSKTEVTNFESPKKNEKTGNYFNQRTKNIAKNLRLIAISEIKNIRNFFVLK